LTTLKLFYVEKAEPTHAGEEYAPGTKQVSISRGRTYGVQSVLFSIWGRARAHQVSLSLLRFRRRTIARASLHVFAAAHTSFIVSRVCTAAPRLCCDLVVMRLSYPFDVFIGQQLATCWPPSVAANLCSLEVCVSLTADGLKPRRDIPLAPWRSMRLISHTRVFQTRGVQATTHVERFWRVAQRGQSSGVLFFCLIPLMYFCCFAYVT